MVVRASFLPFFLCVGLSCVPHELQVVRNVYEWVAKPGCIDGRYCLPGDGSRSLIKRLCSSLYVNLGIFYKTKISLSPYFADRTDGERWHFAEPVFGGDVTVPRITWIGHATVLIQVAGLNIITDPVFWHLHSVLYRRKTAPGIAPEQLPKIDIVLISHDHMDHFCQNSLSFLLQRDHPTCLVPLGIGAFLRSIGYDDQHICELNWGDRAIEPASSVAFSLLPAHHWCGRGVADRNKRLWGSWMIEAQGKKIYFAGDSAAGDHFDAIGRHCGPIDIALLPIGPNDPRTLLSDDHLSTAQAIDAFRALGARVMVPIHWGTFALGADVFEGPLVELNKEITQHAELRGRVRTVKFGEPITVSLPDHIDHELFDQATSAQQAQLRTDQERGRWNTLKLGLLVACGALLTTVHSQS